MAARPSTPPESMPPPRSEVGAIGWLHANLFSSSFNTALTLVSAVALALCLWFGLKWVFLDADWKVIEELGGRFLLGRYNTEAACNGQNCFWRPQAALIMVSVLLGAAWGLRGNRVARTVAWLVAGVSAAFAFLPYNLAIMGLDVRILLLLNLPAVPLGWVLARYTPLGTGSRVTMLGVAIFFLTLVLMRGVPEIAAFHPLVLLAALLWLDLALGTLWGWMEDHIGGRVAALAGSSSGGLAIWMASFIFDVGGLYLALPLIAVAALGWGSGRFTPLGSVAGIIFLVVAGLLLGLLWIFGAPQVPGLQPVSVVYWGGLSLNLILAVGGITLSLPIGIALALGRRSNLPVVKVLCVFFIEVFRGVPLITLLFMSQTLVPLAFPEDMPQNALFRAAVVITLFSSAYMAENIRGGLQALHPGQAEAARALGLPGWQTTLLISLPQAIRNVIPAIVGQFIGLFKDTSLVYIIGMLDVVAIGRSFIQSNPEYLADARELFVFLAAVFWVFTYGMSYISGKVEEHLGVGRR